MAEPKWTEEQQQVITSKKENLLVSAAAGSGKTAVLVEHILQRILDKESPVDIDEIVVVTFTKAAAAEMRERILQGIERERQKQPSDAHLLRQATLVHNAQITTIDSFCGYVVRNHFHEIDLEPDYRIGEEGELKLMHNQVMDWFMEEEYQQAKAPFLAFVDAYSKGNTDAAITDMISRLYEKAQSYPWPKEWLRQSLAAYEVSSVEELQSASWFVALIEKLRQQVQEALEETKELLALCLQPEGPLCYSKGLEQDIRMYEDVLVFEPAAGFYGALSEMKYGTIGRKPPKYTGDEELLNRVKGERDALKKQMEQLMKDFCSHSLEEVVARMQYQRPFVEELVRLTEGFMDAFATCKRKKNVMDFNDVEHFALQILQDETTHEPRMAAREFQQHFKEIIIDEYQDSNYIQEAILTGISRESLGEHNMFMVGDVKQSIYSFRQACPEIFMEKYKTYRNHMAGCRGIELHKNFRSRKEVLDFTNDVFYQLMHEDLGEIEYNEETALYPGADYYEEQGSMFQTEILVGDRDKELFSEAGVEDKIGFEAKLIADKLLQMRKSGMQVTDKATGKLRPMQYRDVVILMRSPNKQADKIIDVLEENGIPAFAESKMGYFNTVEVETVLNLLRVLDNPRQDIPMAAVLHSPMFGLSNDDLAEVRQGHSEKLKPFEEFLETMRSKIDYVPIHELIELVLEETGYLAYVSALPGGQNRRMNLEKLIDQAVAYESTSYKGLFHFVHYIEQCKKYEVDLGEAKTISENDDAVAILSIHKSKGLEYPICIVAGTGRQFNQRDTYNALVMHSRLGIGLDLVDAEAQTKEETLYKRMLVQNIKWDLYGEEMRILYVALTRAKEKLIITGVIPKAEETLEKWQQHRGKMNFHSRAGAKSYLEWIVKATVEKRESYPISVVTPEQVLWEEVSQQAERKLRQQKLQEAVAQVSPAEVQRLEQQLSYVYPFAKETQLKNKYSVSEIKHAGMERIFADSDSATPSFLKKEKEPIVPIFISRQEKQEVNRGALRGTATHRFLECFDFAREDFAASVEAQRQEMLQSGKLHPEENDLLSMDKIHGFLETELAQRMAQAAARGQLYTEKPFVMSKLPEAGGEDAILIQGIIDVFFVEEKHIVLLDYKTDVVQQAEELRQRYEVQLQLYKEAIERSMDLPVKEMLIYSFCLEKTVAL